MSRLVFVEPAHDATRGRRLFDALTAEVPGLGAELACVARPGPRVRADEVVVVVAPLEHPGFADGEPWSAAVLARTIVVAVAPPGTDAFERESALAARAAAVFHVDLRGTQELEARGAPARYLPLRYVPALDLLAERPREERDVDVLVPGASAPRRRAWLRRHAEELAGLRVETLDGDPGEDGAAVLRRSRSVLLLHPEDDAPAFAWWPAIEAILAGAAVVTEHATDAAPLSAGRHLFSGRAEVLPAVLTELAADDVLRGAASTAAYELLRAAPPISASVGLLVGHAWLIVAGSWAGEPVAVR